MLRGSFESSVFFLSPGSEASSGGICEPSGGLSVGDFGTMRVDTTL